MVGIDMLILLLLLLLLGKVPLTTGLAIELTVEVVADVAATVMLPPVLVVVDVVVLAVAKESLPIVIGVKLAETFALNLGTDAMVGVTASLASRREEASLVAVLMVVVAVALSLCLKGQPSFSFLQ